ncbi:hypothetical protein RD792_009463 [Penstemon davidsonii]|uniref:Hexosyltransferase n=1 Tax=Penstemon davidsonii TaxID=160366 RepID=A0ABR0CZ39_9LAMI|nr:hypothetical protein RD792_009463 [Penstemon davidsonii]
MRRCALVSLFRASDGVAVPVFTKLDKLLLRLTVKHRADTQTLSALEQEVNEGLQEPPLVVYKDDTSNSANNFNYRDDTKLDGFTDDSDLLVNNATRDDLNGGGQKRQQEEKLLVSESKGFFFCSLKVESQVDRVRHGQGVRTMSRRTLDEKVKEMKDQVIRAKAYLNFIPANSTSGSHFVKELKLRIKEVERAMSQSAKDSRLSRSSLQKMKAMESILSKASSIYPDCAAMVKKLSAMTYTAEEQVRSQRNQETFLRKLGARTIPKGLHCLSMRLTAEYFALKPKERELPNKHKLRWHDHYHFAVFSDNILACSVVVNSTVSTASDPESVVFHIVTDSINFPAMTMWFLLNPPGKATVNVESIDNYKSLPAKYNVALQKEVSVDPRYNSELNHLRFYLGDVFRRLRKIVLLDHDVVVQRDLTSLWAIDMKGKTNGAVPTCTLGEPSFRRMDMFVNFKDRIIAKKFDPRACTWAFGMNIFDLKEWRRRNFTAEYHKYLHLDNKRGLFKAGSLPIGWITFYKQWLPLNKRWHVLGLGYDSGVRQEDIDQAAVIHYDGILKPWLDIGIEKYKHLWRKHIKYEHPYLQQCNIH